jgi:cyclopropane fatty-acyl-phospholipid synthase-like methyltransferase
MSDSASDRRQFAPATQRNREPILAVLRRALPSKAAVLEIASGTGQHAVFLASALPGARWQPSDRDDDSLASITAWIASEGCTNVAPPVRLDVTAELWRVGVFDAIFVANLIHIAPWRACAGLMRGAAAHLVSNGVLILYGPFKIGGEHTAPSNAAFDADLRARDRSWGVRDLEAVAAEARAHGLVLDERVAMPANNQTLIFRRTD